MRKFILVLGTALFAIQAYPQVSSKINDRGRIVNQIKAYGRVAYQGIDYYPIGANSLLAKGGCADQDSVIIPRTLKIDGKPYVVSGLKPSAFEYNHDIEFVSLPPSVSEIASSSFFHCHRLRACKMPNVRVIGGSAFASTSIGPIKFPESLEVIGHSAFIDCHELKTVELPKSLRYIDDMAFLGCSRLDTVKVNFSDPIKIGSWVFWNRRPNSSNHQIVLSVPAGSRQAFREDEHWSWFDTIVEH